MRKVVFVPHCILNQNVRAFGKERQRGSIKEIVKFFAEADVGIIQLPCPEAEFGSNSSGSYQKACKKLSLKILKDIKNYLESGYEVVGILGVEFSKTCGVYRIESGSRVIPGKGVLTEELENGMREENFQVPIISVNTSNVFSTLEKLSLLMKNS
jgi:predicted secreted protein